MGLKKKLQANRRDQRKKRNTRVMYTFTYSISLVFIFITNLHQFSSWQTCNMQQEMHSCRPKENSFSAKLGNTAYHSYNSIMNIYLIIIIWIIIVVFIVIIFIRVLIIVIWTIIVSWLTRSHASWRWWRSHASWRWWGTTRWKWRALKRRSAWWRWSPTRRRSS